MENRNTLIAVLLMLAVWIGFTVLFPPVSQQPVEPQRQAHEREQPFSSPAVSPPVLPLPAEGPSTPQVSAEDVEVLVDTELYRLVLSSRGARITALHLHEYTETAAGDSPPLAMVQADSDRLGSLRTTGNETFSIPADLNYAVSERQVALSGSASQQVVFSARTVSGLLVEKIFTFAGDSYHFQLEQRVTNTGGDSLRGQLSLTLVEPVREGQGTWESFIGPVTLEGEKRQEDAADDLLKGSRTYGQQVVWSGYQTKYFLSAILPRENAAERLRIERVNQLVELSFDSPQMTLAPGASQALAYLVYFGPRETSVLAAADARLTEAVDFGFFSPISRPLLTVLNYFYGYVGNYGLAIIILTVIIKILFWPLTHKSYASMKAMQQLQPEMQKIREKFKNDKEKLNRELMELYKNRRVNPLGGCLPMLVQIPVFFALYKVLMESIEMRHAEFFWWITDLSAKDPYYVTPLIMGATMFIQQKLTPTTMDPMQAKVFMLMPIVFTFLFLNFPSGLVLYWLVNNLLTIVQQVYIHRKA
jgi:YidC/Oxa1 family membrane protein insertase